MTSDSHALHTPTLCVFAFSIILSAMSKSALSSTYTWQLPVPVSMTGTVAFFTTNCISPLPPRGIITSTYSFIVSSSFTHSLSVDSISCKAFSSMPFALSASLITFAMAMLELIASLPPFNMTAFPVLKHSPKVSKVTFGLDS